MGPQKDTKYMRHLRNIADSKFVGNRNRIFLSRCLLHIAPEAALGPASTSAEAQSRNKKESERKNVQESKHVTRYQKMSKHEPPKKTIRNPESKVFLGFDLWFQRLWSSSHWVAALNQPDLGPSLVALVVGDGMSRCGFISYFVAQFANSDFDIEFHNLNYKWQCVKTLYPWWTSK